MENTPQSKNILQVKSQGKNQESFNFLSYQNNYTLSYFDLSTAHPISQPSEEVKSYIKSHKKKFNVEDLKENIARSFSGDETVKDNIAVDTGIFEILRKIYELPDSGTKKAIIVTPSFGYYDCQLNDLGYKTIHHKTKKSNSFKIDVNKLKKTIKNNQDSQFLIINNPNNPLGTVLKKKERDEIVKLIDDENIKRKEEGLKPLYLIADEIFVDSVVDNESEFHSLYDKSIRNYVICLNGVSKTKGLAGLRVSWAYLPDEIKNAYLKKHGNLISPLCSNLHLGIANAALEYCKENIDYQEEVNKIFNRRVNLVQKFMQNLGGDLYVTSKSGNTCLLDFSKCTDLGNDIKDDVALSYFLLKSLKIGVVPGSCSFIDKGEMIVRISLAESDDIIKQVFEVIKSGIELKKTGYNNKKIEEITDNINNTTLGFIPKEEESLRENLRKLLGEKPPHHHLERETMESGVTAKIKEILRKKYRLEGDIEAIIKTDRESEEFSKEINNKQLGIEEEKCGCISIFFSATEKGKEYLNNHGNELVLSKINEKKIVEEIDKTINLNDYKKLGKRQSNFSTPFKKNKKIKIETDKKEYDNLMKNLNNDEMTAEHTGCNSPKTDISLLAFRNRNNSAECSF